MHKIVQERQAARNRRAEQLRNLRKMGFYGAARSIRSEIIPEKPTKDNLEEEAALLLSYSRSPVRSGWCGHEDGQAADREDAREFARELLEAAATL